MLPAEPGVSFEVVESERGFEFSVVVFDAPADLGQACEVFERCAGIEGGYPVVGGFDCPGGSFGE